MKMTIKTADDLAAEQAAREAEAARIEARAYLADTDWMIVRQAETGKPVPQDVMDRRAAARDVSNKAPG